MSEARAPAPGRDTTASGVAVLVTLVVSTATALLTVTSVHGYHQAANHFAEFAMFVAVTGILQVAAIEVYGRGTLSFASSGTLAIGFGFGVGAAMTVAAAMTLIVIAFRRPKIHRALFDAGNLALATGTGTALYHVFSPDHWSSGARLGPATLAGVAYGAVNMGLLLLAMSLSEGISPRAIWNERFGWRTPYYIVTGPLALALIIAYEKLGATGTLAFTLPPAMMMVSVRQYTKRTQESVEEIRATNEELKLTNAELAIRNADLHDLFEFTAGLAAQSHDGDALAGYAKSALERLVGAQVGVSLGSLEDRETPLVSGGKVVGGLRVEGGDAERWGRLREAIEPQLATSLESASLVEQVRKTHLDTIAALSRSMSAKDYYTGGHTERVSDIAVALASRVGMKGVDLDAIEIGALLHDIGKIGIPESILHKPGPLDEEEWTVMKRHPLISEFILSEIDLPASVLQIARHSHERMDGHGYPDGLAGEQIPLPARIVLVADAFDALTSDRPYRPARTAHIALEEIRTHTGTQFCPRVVEALEALYREDPGVLGSGAPPQLTVVA